MWGINMKKLYTFSIGLIALLIMAASVSAASDSKTSGSGADGYATWDFTKEDGKSMSLFQNFPHTFFQHRMKHAISNSPLKTTLSLSYLLANFLNPIFNHAKNRSIVPLFE